MKNRRSFLRLLALTPLFAVPFVPTQKVVTLVVDASGVKTGVAEFEAAMSRARLAGEATSRRFMESQLRLISEMHVDARRAT